MQWAGRRVDPVASGPAAWGETILAACARFASVSKPKSCRETQQQVPSPLNKDNQICWTFRDIYGGRPQLQRWEKAGPLYRWVDIELSDTPLSK